MLYILVLYRYISELTGAVTMPREEIGPDYSIQLDKFQVTKEELDVFKQNAPSVISESLLKKLQEINQVHFEVVWETCALTPLAF